PDTQWWGARMRHPVGFYTGFFDTVPVAKFRVIAVSAGSKPWTMGAVTFDVGITSTKLSFLLALLAVGVAWGTLYYFGTKCGVPGKDPFLKIISTSRGYASLSQLQIVLWSFVIGAGAVYVMSLSGTLINITSGTLILLGITGAAT